MLLTSRSFAAMPTSFDWFGRPLPSFFAHKTWALEHKLGFSDESANKLLALASELKVEASRARRESTTSGESLPTYFHPFKHLLNSFLCSCDAKWWSFRLSASI